MIEPSITVQAPNNIRIFVARGERLIVTPERAEALGPDFAIPAPAPIPPAHRMTRSPLNKPERADPK